MSAAKLLLAAATVAALIGLPATAKAEPGDTVLLGSLDAIGIQYPNPTQAVTSAREVCEYIAQGHTSNQAARGLKNANPELTLTQASQFVAAARAAYCSQSPTSGSES